MIVDFFFDFETRSHLDIKKSGSVRYATDPSTEATLITYCFGRTGSLKYWRYRQPLPQELINVGTNPQNFNFIAANVEFDYMIWIHAFMSRYGIKLGTIPLSNIHDALALTSHYRVGNSLGTAAEMLDLPLEKDKKGRAIMLKQCKPSKKTGKFPELTEEEWEHFIRYGLLDTRILREIYYRCPKLPMTERWIWEWTFRRNLQGIRVDVALINEMHSIVEQNYPVLLKQFNYYTGGNFTPKSAQKCKAWFQQFWPEIQDMRKDTVRDMLMSTEGKPQHAIEALKIKEMAGSNAIAKVGVAANQTFAGRIYNTLIYHKTQTKRWAGSGIQVQNMPRPEKLTDEPELVINRDDLADQLKRARPYLKKPLSVVKSLIRRFWIPDEGMHFYCGDFSKIEPTVLRWLSNMGEIPPKVYEEMAEAIYNIPMAQIGKDSEERQIGKAAELGGGYGMGWRKFKKDVYEKTGIVISDEMAKHVIKVYRDKNKPITNLWKVFEAAFRKAVKGEPSVVCDGKVAFGPMPNGRGVQIRLPSGGMLFYHKAFERTEREEVEVVTIHNGVPHIAKRTVYRDNIYYIGDDQGKARKIKLYGGQLTEHITSAISRELLAPSMWRVENAGFGVLCCVHDEIWAQSYPGRDEEFKQLMIQRPLWGQDIVIDAGLDNGLRYLK
jgi:DNA polymerase